MSVYLKSLQIREFLCYDGQKQFNFDPKLNVIIGPNGSGKTTLLDAISIILYGKPTRNTLKKKHLSKLTSIIGKYSTGDVIQFANGKFLVNGKSVLKTVYAKRFEDSDLFQLCVMSQGTSLWPFNLPPKTRKTVIQQIFSSRYEEYFNHCNEVKKYLAVKDLGSLDVKIKNVNQQLHDICKKIKQLEREIRELKKRLAELDTFVKRKTELETKIKVKRDQVRRLENLRISQERIQETERRITDYGKEIDFVYKNLQTYLDMDIVKKTSLLLSECASKYGPTLYQLISNKERLQRIVDQTMKEPDEVKIFEEYVNKQAGELDDGLSIQPLKWVKDWAIRYVELPRYIAEYVKKGLVDDNYDVKDAQEDLRLLEQIIDLLQKYNKATFDDLMAYFKSDEMQQIQKYIEELMQKYNCSDVTNLINIIQSNREKDLEYISQCKRTENDYQEAVEQLKSLEQQYRKLRNIQQTGNIRELTDKLTYLLEQRQDLVMMKNTLEKSLHKLKKLDSIRNEVDLLLRVHKTLEEYIPKLHYRTLDSVIEIFKYYYSLFFPDFEVEIDENFNIQTDRILSGGQMSVAGILFRIAVIKVLGIPQGLALLLDEPEFIDETRLAMLLEVLSDIGIQVFLVSHYNIVTQYGNRIEIQRGSVM